MSATGPDQNPTLETVSRVAGHLAATIRGALSGLRVQSGETWIEVTWSKEVGRPGRPVDAEDDQERPAPVAYICSPMVGTFYQAPEPGGLPFVTVGDVVEPGQQVGLVEAMKLMNRVDADSAGRVMEIMVANGAPVEYAQRLIALAPLQSP